MKKIMNMVTLLLLLLGSTAMAQTKNSITGIVKDNNSKPIAAVTVSLLKSTDSSLVKTAITDAGGKFEIAINKTGVYLLHYNLIGFQPTYTVPFVLGEGQAFAANTVSLHPATNDLKEVKVVAAKKPLVEVKADRTVFNVESSINATGSNALELLQKSPGMQVDNNDNISMKGKTGVRVYEDGKMMQLDTKDLAEYLKSINSNDIEAIEMISNPSAKYDASGNAGIVNIRLKKNKKFGTNGSTSLGFVQGVTPKGNGSINLNYRDKKINIFGNASASIGRNENTLDLNRKQKDSLYDQTSTNRNKNKSFNIKTGADLFISSKSTFGVMATVNASDYNWSSESHTPIYYMPTGAFVKDLTAYNTIKGNRTNANFNINYRYADTSGTEVNFDGDYGLFRAVGRSYQPNYYTGTSGNYSVINRNHTPTDIDIYTAKVDAEQKLGKSKIGYGAKVSFVTTKNTFDFFNDNAAGSPIKILSRSNSFKYKENVNAAYVNYNTAFGKKWTLQAGVRMEQTNSEGTLTRADGTVQTDGQVKRDYLNLFPSAALTWNVNDKHSWNLAYSRRIDRPTYQDLNPFENKLDELTYEKGNAFLRPQYTDNVALTHTFMGFISTSAGYSYVKDYATQVTDTTNNATYVQQQNLATQEMLSFSISAPLPIKKWWNGFVNIWYNYQMFEGSIGNNIVKVDIPLYGAYMQHTFNLGKDYSAEISGWYNGPSIWGATWRTKQQWAMDLGIQKQLMQKKATIKLSFTDIFHTAPWKSTNDFGGVNIKGRGSWESQTMRLNFTWRFGSNNIKASRSRQTGLENESKRIK